MCLKLDHYRQRMEIYDCHILRQEKSNRNNLCGKITKNTNKNLSTEASSRRIRPVCVDLGTAVGKYGLYTEVVYSLTIAK